MEKTKTGRGFALANFKDRNGRECSIQKSSIATEECIWLGANKIELKEFKAFEGWKDRPEFDNDSSTENYFVANNRMHLNQEQVIALLPMLQKFAETGEL